MREDDPRAGWATALPENWCWAKFFDVALDQTDSKRKLPTSQYKASGDYPVIDQGNEFVSGFTDEADLVSKANLPCIVWGDHTRRTKFVEMPFVQGADGVKVLEPSKAVIPSFFAKQVAFAELPDKGYSRHFKFLRAKEFPLPPLPEQRRIVRKLDTLSARSSTARTHLTAIEKLVERYRKAVFLAAYKGDLSSPNVPRYSSAEEGLWAIPQGWEWKTIEDVAEIQLALTPVSEIKDLPHIAPDNVEKNTGRLLPYRTIAEDKVISAKHRFYSGQIVYSKIRPYLRKAVLPTFDGACSADMYPVAPKENCDIRFLFFWLLSEEYAYFASRSEGRTVLPKINKKQMYASPIPLPSLEEQREIVRRIETAFAKIDRLAAEAAKALKLLGHLDQRILAKAFAGDLVPQDPTDEPAETLLARINEALATAPKGKRGRRAKA